VSSSRRRDLLRRFNGLRPQAPGRRWKSFKKAFDRHQLFTWVPLGAEYGKDEPLYVHPSEA
jgi:hypothetical protein